MENKFTDDDKQKVIQFLNFIAGKAKFDVNTHEIIEYFKLLNHMQKHIIPKIDSNILEIVAVHDAKGEE